MERRKGIGWGRGGGERDRSGGQRSLCGKPHPHREPHAQSNFPIVQSGFIER